MKICNKEVKVIKNESMNNIDYVSDILETTKNMINNYSYALNEASNEYLYNKYLDIFNETSKIQRDLFNLLFKNGWYILETIDSKKVDSSYNKYNKYLEEI